MIQNKSRETNVYLIDATGFCYRAFYALKGLSTSYGQPTNAVYGFVTMLNKIIREKKPQYIAACFDVSRDTFRLKRFAGYKIQRRPMADELASQIPLIKQIISAYGIAILEKQGFEADDLIATAANRAREKGFFVTIVSSDKDILQLVDEHTTVFNPYKEEGIIYDIKKVRENFGVLPGQMQDIIALMGDQTDNIPGAKGIGEKTAIELIKTFGNIETLLNNIDNIKQPRVKKAVIDGIENIKLSRELAVLDTNVDVDFNLDDLKTGTADSKGLFSLFRQLEFKKFLRELSYNEILPPMKNRGQNDRGGGGKIEAGGWKIEDRGGAQDLNRNDEEGTSVLPKEVFLRDSDLAGVGDLKELFLYGTGKENIVFYAGKEIFRLSDFGDNIKNILADPKISKTSHNLKKLKVLLAREGIVLDGLGFDISIAGHLLNPVSSAENLQDIAIEHLEETAFSKTIDNCKLLELILKLKPILEDKLRQKNLSEVFNNIEMPLIEVLADMELNGIKFDLVLLKDFSGDLEKQLIKLISDIYQISGTEFNINSPKQLREILFEKLKLPVVKRSKTGPSTDEEVLKKLSLSHKLPAFLLEYRHLTKLKGTYVDALIELADVQTARVYTCFNQTATQTGRLSSSEPNLQNLPVKTETGSKIRQAVIASDNCYLLAIDYSQVELRLLAHLSGDENLIQAFKNGKDIHKMTAGLIFGVQEKDVNEQMRETAKRINFGIIYGLSAYGLSKDLEVPVEQAGAFIDAYFARYPRVRDYIDRQIKKAEEQGFVTTISGRRRDIPQINSPNQMLRQFAERQAVNTPVQGSASDLIKLAMIEIYRLIKDKQFKGKMLLQVHDELVFEVPEDELNEFSRLVSQKMENVLELAVPVKVSVKKGKNWLEMEEIG